MNAYKVVISKSTVPVGTAHTVASEVARTLARRGADLRFDVVSNPEFLKEGSAVNDCLRPDRIVVGSDNPEIEDLLRELYAPFNRNRDRMIFMDVRSAELTKYAANGLLATKISFINDIANLAERLGADAEKVRMGIGADPRIGYHFIYPGCGYGGSCFPKDIQALIRSGREVDYDLELMRAVERVNERQKMRLFDLIASHFDYDLEGRSFGLWGLAFKANTDDMREAPSRTVIDALLRAGAGVRAYDPEAMDECHRLYGERTGLTLAPSKEDAASGADAIVICTEWAEFRSPDFDVIKTCLRQPLIFDGRNLYDPARMAQRGFRYYAIGRGASVAHPGRPEQLREHARRLAS